MRPDPKSHLPSISVQPMRDDKEQFYSSETRRYQLITPLFGGGVAPGEVDPITVVRATEIRGHLRFWWRATRGGNYASLSELKTAESAIWGTTSAPGRPGPSKVQVTLRLINEGQVDHPFRVTAHPQTGRPRIELGNNTVVPPYAAFPLQPPQSGLVVGMNTKAVRVGVIFEISLSYPSRLSADVDAALWTWETFGGLGARTRRGFGALKRIDNQAHLPSDATADSHIREHLQKHRGSGPWPTGVPHVSLIATDLRVLLNIGSNATSVWRRLIEDLKDFRQHRPGNPPRLGRSHWPEPDAIRRLTSNSPNHAPRNPVNKFPRAVFGLPIIFHFKKDDVQAGDPRDTILQMSGEIDRLASPLILRPYACAGGRVVGLATVLQSSPRFPAPLVLKGAPLEPQVESELTVAEAKLLGDTVSDNPDVLTAFLDYLEDN